MLAIICEYGYRLHFLQSQYLETKTDDLMLC